MIPTYSQGCKPLFQENFAIKTRSTGSNGQMQLELKRCEAGPIRGWEGPNVESKTIRWFLAAGGVRTPDSRAVQGSTVVHITVGHITSLQSPFLAKNRQMPCFWSWLWNFFMKYPNVVPIIFVCHHAYWEDLLYLLKLWGNNIFQFFFVWRSAFICWKENIGKLRLFGPISLLIRHNYLSFK